MPPCKRAMCSRIVSDLHHLHWIQDLREISNVRQWDPETDECQVNLPRSVADRALKHVQLLFTLDPYSDVTPTNERDECSSRCRCPHCERQSVTSPVLKNMDLTPIPDFFTGPEKA